MELPQTHSECTTGVLAAEALTNLVVFGASYCTSTVDEEDDEITDADAELVWVDHLRIHSKSLGIQTKVHNYAFSGATAESDLAPELASFFNDFPAKDSPQSELALDPVHTTYALFLGINDCGGQEDLPDIVEKILDAMHILYIKAGARNFIVMNVPPVDRSPAAAGIRPAVRMRVEEWNDLLQAKVEEFQQETPRANVVLFSAHAVITDVLDRPREYGFEDDDVMEEGGAIWADELHVSSKVHEVLALRLLESVTT